MDEFFEIAGAWTALILAGFCMFGYVANIYYFMAADFEAPYKEEVIRGASIPFVPLGIIAGYIDLNEIKPGKQ